MIPMLRVLSSGVILDTLYPFPLPFPKAYQR
jgi:hypothetical protein